MGNFKEGQVPRYIRIFDKIQDLSLFESELRNLVTEVLGEKDGQLNDAKLSAPASLNQFLENTSEVLNQIINDLREDLGNLREGLA